MHTKSHKNLKISSKQFESLKELINNFYFFYKENLLEVNLFGSFARGTNKKYSSIDLLIIVREHEKRLLRRVAEINRLIFEQEEKGHFLDIDPLVYTEEEVYDLVGKKESFILSALEESIVIYTNYSKDIYASIKNVQKCKYTPSRYLQATTKLGKI